MTKDIIIPTIALIAGLISGLGWSVFTYSGRLRNSLKDDIAIYNTMHGGIAKRRLKLTIESRVRALASESDSEARSEAKVYRICWFLLSAALVFAVYAVVFNGSGLAVATVISLVIYGILLLLGMLGMADNIRSQIKRRNATFDEDSVRPLS